MTTFEGLVTAQDETGNTILTIVRNYKKDPADRKVKTSYYEERINQLAAAMSKFSNAHQEIMELTNVPTNHEYFTKDYYVEVMTIATQYRKQFEAELQDLQRKTTNDTNRDSEADPNADNERSGSKKTPLPQQQSSEGEVAVVTRMMRRQRALIGSMSRLLDGIERHSDDQDQLMEVNLQQISKLWQEIENINYGIWEMCDDPSSVGYNFDEYLACENRVQEKRRQLLILNEAPKPSLQAATISNNEPLRLPRVTIPQFDGDYMKWRPFFDMFAQLVHEQPLPKVHKMWYLKTNLIGDAEKLIRHLELTESNYDVACDMIKNRYNNKRILCSTLINRLLETPFNASSVTSIKSLHDTTHECLMSLEGLGITTSSWDPLLLHLLLKKMDKDTYVMYERSLKKPKELPNIKEFLAFLESQFQALEAVNYKEKHVKPRLYTAAISTKHELRHECIICKKGTHPIFACAQFLNLKPVDRIQLIKKNKLCLNCLKEGHFAKACSSRKCTKCNKLHNSLLHINEKNEVSRKEGTLGASVTKTRSLVVAPANPVSLSTAADTPNKKYVLLSTVRLRLVSNSGLEVECRAILDSGSQVNLVTERLVKQLGVQRKHTSVALEGIGAQGKECRHRINVGMRSNTGQFASRLEALVLPTIVNDQPSLLLNVSSWQIPRDIQLADPTFNQPGRIDVLLGAEFFHQIMSVGQIDLGSKLPKLQNTVFGWVVTGKIDGLQQDTATCGVFSEDEETTNKLLEKFWRLEEKEGNAPEFTATEKRCESHFIHNTVRVPEGRFMVKIAFYDNPETLGESKNMALNRFLALERRLSKNYELKRAYAEFMDEYERLGHMTEVHSHQWDNMCYVIPHHCVIRPESSSTKLRVVFDASAKTSSGLSLNEIMHTGPVIQNDLFTVLLRFRLPRYVFTADIQKMYRQILVHPDDRKYQLIIWRAAPEAKLKYYQLNTVTYGTRAAPYLAIRCLQQLAKENQSNHPLGSEALQNNFYVDDCLVGSNSLSSAILIQKEITTILSSAGFELRKWCANHPQLLHEIPTDHQEINLDFDTKSNDYVKTLGLAWLPKTDSFRIKIGATCSSRRLTTKRSVSSDVARIFDPLGIMAPVVIIAKIFLQQLWDVKISWDEPLSTQQHNEWTDFRQSFNELNNWEFPRHIYNHEIPKSWQLHVFTDASEKAYGAVIYLRSVTSNGRILVRLLCAKSRVAPLNRQRQTIARLELCAALLGAQLAARVQRDLQYGIDCTHFWSDSEVVLAWINTDSSSYEVFVANRIAKIQDLSTAMQWRYVPSKQNPADVLSRGCNPRSFTQCDLWFYGPLFLHGRETEWIRPACEYKIKSTQEGKRKAPASLITAQVEAATIIYSINHKNSFRKLQRILGYVIRFGKRMRHLQKEQHNSWAFSPLELDSALKMIIKAIQAGDFASEISDLQKDNVVKTNSTIHCLKPFLDGEGILRVGGRLEASSLPNENKHQMCLPYNDPVVKLLMQTIHEENMHCGPTTLVALTKQRFWPVKAASMARSIVHHCVRCLKARPQLLQQLMGNLPAARVTPARPFINAGVDYCGPFWIHYKLRGKRPTKAYLAIFCCFTTKAVHLELVSDLTTEAFLGALKRFIARRGRCQNLYSDNATNFVGARNQLVELTTSIYSPSAREKIVNTCSEKGINFHFIPPRAPHFGGLWEAAVKSAKHLLLRSTAAASLTYEELETIIVEAEAILNSRPISPMSNDPNDLTALTPGHFLIGESLTAQVDARAVEQKASLGARWKAVSQVKHEFWQRWSRDYLNELQHRYKWREQANNIKVGTVVIIKQDDTPVLQWPLGRITKIHKGIDELVRVVEVKTTSGTFKRPIHRLAPLPIENNIDPLPRKDHTSSNESSSSQSACQRYNDKSQPEHKRPRRSSTLVTALLIAMVMLPIVLATGVENQEFDSRMGMHFDALGSMKIARSNWRLIVYYDLKPYWSEMEIFSNKTRTLRKLCQIMTLKQICGDVVTTLEHAEERLQLDNSLLAATRPKEKMSRNSRTKRGALNFVGNVAHSLFGVLDSEYENQMSDTIEAVKQNEGHLQHLLKNQTSILDATINIFKHDQLESKRKFDNIDNLVNKTWKKISDTEYQSKVLQSFLSSAMQLIVVAANLQRVQVSIIDVLTDTHHGRISTSLLTPQQLQQELVKIRNHLPSFLQLPIHHDDYTQLYKLMSAEGGLTENQVRFNISIPLCDQQAFTLYKLIALPTTVNNVFVKIKRCNDILAINSYRDQYISMSSYDLSSCVKITENGYLCTNNFQIYMKVSEMCSCELNLLHNDSRDDCNVEEEKLNSTWTQLSHRNQWLYTVSSPRRITAVCNEEVQQLNLKKSGIITLQPQCVIKDKDTTIQAQRSYSSNLYTSYTGFGNLTDVAKPEQLYILLHEPQQYNTRLEQLSKLQESLKQQEIWDLPSRIDSHNYHHTTIGYTALIISIAVIVVIIIKARSSTAQALNRNPQPAPRQISTSPDFAISIE